MNNPGREKLQLLLAGQPAPPCAKLTPFFIEMADLDTGKLTLMFSEQPAFKNHFGVMQGGFLVAMVDVLISLAVYAKTLQWLPTVEIKSTFMSPVPVAQCRGEVSIIKAGKRLIFLEAKLFNINDDLSVYATATVMMS